MCDPVSALIATTIASTGMSMISGYQQSQAQSDYYDYQSQVAADNAELAQQYADNALATGDAAEQETRRATAALMGQQRAGYGASGVLVDSGSAANVTADTAMLGELDAQTVKNDAQWTAYGYLVQGVNYENSSALYASSAANAETAGYTSMATSLLSGASSVAGTWLKYGSTGGITTSGITSYDAGTNSTDSIF